MPMRQAARPVALLPLPHRPPAMEVRTPIMRQIQVFPLHMLQRPREVMVLPLHPREVMVLLLVTVRHLHPREVTVPAPPNRRQEPV